MPKVRVHRTIDYSPTIAPVECSLQRFFTSALLSLLDFGYSAKGIGIKITQKRTKSHILTEIWLFNLIYSNYTKITPGY